MTNASSALLDEWRRPDRDVRIAVEELRALRDVSEQYVSPPRSLRLLVNYVVRFGLVDAARKVHSRLSERGRNRKIAAYGHGTVLEAPAGCGIAPGDLVAFFAPSAAPDAERIVVDQAFVRLASERALPPPSTALPDELAGFLAWSPHSGVPLDEKAIRRGLGELAATSSPDAGPAERQAPAPVIAERRDLPRTKPAQPSVGIFGLGNYAKQMILPNLPASAELVRIHELDPRQLAGSKRDDVSLDTSPWPRDDENYDLWFVAGYHATHTPIALTALERGGAVAIEKPIATTREQIQALEAALRADSSARIFACFQRRYAAYTDWIRKDLQAEPGDPINYDCIVYEIPLSPLHWYCWPSSGSRIISNGCHWIDHFMQLNDYADVVESHAIPGRHNGCTAFIALANGAEFVMRLTEIGTPRIGVRDYIETSLGSRTAVIRDAQFYRAEDASRTLRKKRVEVLDAYREMYRSIGRRALAGEPGDSLESLKSSAITIELDHQLRAKLGLSAARDAQQ